MNDSPQLFVIAGPNGAGKSSVASTFVSAQGIEVLDADKMLRDLQKFELPDADTRAWEVFYERVSENLATKKSFGFETNFHSHEIVTDPDSIIQRATQKGYTTNLVFIGLESPELALKRVEQRVKDGLHHVTEATVRARFAGGLETLQKYFHQFDNALVLDNSGEARTILRAERGKITQLSDQVPKWVKQTLDTPLALWQEQQITRGMKR